MDEDKAIVKLPRGLVRRAKRKATAKGLSLPDYLEATLRRAMDGSDVASAVSGNTHPTAA